MNYAMEKPRSKDVKEDEPEGTVWMIQSKSESVSLRRFSSVRTEKSESQRVMNQSHDKVNSA